MGDVILTAPALAALAEREAAGLVLVGRPAFLNLVAGWSFVERVADHAAAGWAGLYQDPPRPGERETTLIHACRQALVFAPKQTDPAADGLTALGLPVLMAPSRPPAVDVHLTDHMLGRLGLAAPTPPPLLTVPARGLAEADRWLEGQGIQTGDFVLLHPGSGGRHKNWPVDRWLETARRLADRGARPVFLAGPADRDQARAVLEEGRFPLADRLGLDALAGLLARSQGLIGHDSGVSHLAAALGRPTLALFGPTNPAHWAPRGPAVRVLAPARPVSGDWTHITPETVAAAWLDRLQP